MGSLSGKVAFITGAARGQGVLTRWRWRRAGADVALCDIAADIGSVKYPMGTKDQLAETVAMVEKLDRRALSFVADVRDREAVQRAVDETVSELGRLDILLANAGIYSQGPIPGLSDDSWREMIDVNLTGVFHAMRAVIPTMVEQGSGRIVATSSMAAKTGAPHMAHYVAAKWGVVGLVKSAALELATTGVTVNAICPTNVKTDMLTNSDMLSMFLPGVENPTLEQATPVFSSTVPMGIPWVEPEDISAAMLYLVSDGARYVTGETIAVSGGQIAHSVG